MPYLAGGVCVGVKRGDGAAAVKKEGGAVAPSRSPGAAPWVWGRPSPAPQSLGLASVRVSAFGFLRGTRRDERGSLAGSASEQMTRSCACVPGLGCVVYGPIYIIKFVGQILGIHLNIGKHP